MSRFYVPIASFLENDSDSLRKRILGLMYAAIWEESSPDVVRYLLDAYEAECEDKEVPEGETLTDEAANDFMYKLYVKESVRIRKNRGLPHDEDSIAEGYDWPEPLPRHYDVRIGILRSVALRMAAADAYQYQQLRKAMLEFDHSETMKSAV